MVGPLVHAVLDDPADPEAVRVRVECHPLDPDPQPYRFLLGLLGRILSCTSSTDRNVVAKTRSPADEVGEVPEVVDALGKEAYLPVGTPHLEEISLHLLSPPIPRAGQTP